MAAALRKAGRLLFLCILGPFVLCIRALKPLKLIRFGAIHGQRMGHLAIEPSLHLLLRESGVYPAASLDVFYFDRPIANRQLQRMWCRVPETHFSRLSYFMDVANRMIPGGEAHRIPNLWELWPASTSQPSPSLPRLSMRSPVRLSFTHEEEQRGRMALREMGLPDGSAFVCFNARDPLFLDTVLPARDWGYHSYRDASIQDYCPAIDELTGRGYWGIRMGALVKDALQSGNPRIVDYATRWRTDFMDVFLCASCRFLINDSSGLMSVCVDFRRPLVLVNIIPIGVGFAFYTYEDRALYIPKRLRRRLDRRFLTFREILGSEIGRFSRSEDYERAGLDVVCNTPQEILAVALEMADRLDGRWLAHPEDDDLQQRYERILSDCGYRHTGPCRIGAAFLREHRAMLQ